MWIFEAIVMTVLMAAFCLCAIMMCIFLTTLVPLWVDIILGTLILGFICFAYLSIKSIWD